MDWPEALDVVVARTKHERYRALCDDGHPDHEHHRARVIELATGQIPAEYPGLLRQAVNLAGSIGQVVAAAAKGEPIRVETEVLEQRRALCLGCDLNGEKASGGIRCTQCGCSGIKLEFAALRCPVGKWEAATAPRSIPAPPG